eukprot:4363676-Amphidinium_carterae.1
MDGLCTFACEALARRHLLRKRSEDHEAELLKSSRGRGTSRPCGCLSPDFSSVVQSHPSKLAQGLTLVRGSLLRKHHTAWRLSATSTRSDSSPPRCSICCMLANADRPDFVKGSRLPLSKVSFQTLHCLRPPITKFRNSVPVVVVALEQGKLSQKQR